MRLQMKERDVDTYIATFERLAAAAGWELDAAGTIARFRNGLTEPIQRGIIIRNRPLPTNFQGYKKAAREEVELAKELWNALGPAKNAFGNHFGQGQFQNN